MLLRKTVGDLKLSMSKIFVYYLNILLNSNVWWFLFWLNIGYIICASPMDLCHCDAESRDSEGGGDRYLIPSALRHIPLSREDTATATCTGDLIVQINIHKSMHK